MPERRDLILELLKRATGPLPLRALMHLLSCSEYMILMALEELISEGLVEATETGLKLKSTPKEGKLLKLP